MPPRAEEPVVFDKADTLHSALGKLHQVGGSRPFVVLAPNCRIADNVLTYKLLARASREYAAPVAVVAGNPRWRQLAREQGLRAYASVGSLRRARRRSLLAIPERIVDALLSGLHLSFSREGWAIVGGLLALAGVAVFFLLPVLSVTIRTPVEVLNREVDVQVDVGIASVDPSSATIPARTVEHRFAVTDFVETTGNRNIGREKARGEVTLINSGLAVVVLPAGTLLSAGSGERFSTTMVAIVGPPGQPGVLVAPTASPRAAGGTPSATQRAFTATPTPTSTQRPASPTPASAPAGAGPTGIPGSAAGVSGTVVRVPVVAVEAGVKGNVPALAISQVEGEAFRGVTVFNEQPLTGGTEEKARTASAEDRGRLKEALFQKVQTQALSELTLRVRQSESLIPHSLQVRIDREEYNKAQDEESDRLEGTVQVAASAVTFTNGDLNSVAEREWKSALPKGYRSLAGALNVSPPEVVEAGAKAARLKVKLAGRAERLLETDDLAQSLRGVSLPEARSRLTRLESPLRLERLEMWPTWAPRAYRIEVQTVQ